MIATFYDYFFFLIIIIVVFTQIIVLLITVNQLFLSNSLNTHLQLRYYLVHVGISYQIVFLIQKLPYILFVYCFPIQKTNKISKIW